MNRRGSDPLAGAADHVWIGSRREARSRRGARSYLDDGRVVVWSPTGAGGRAIAVDAERRRSAPAGLAASVLLATANDLWTEWTRLEVHCKLTDTPVVVALHRGALPAPAPGTRIRTTVLEVGDVVVCCGVAEPVPRPGGS